jgi:hypothetical protein
LPLRAERDSYARISAGDDQRSDRFAWLHSWLRIRLAFGDGYVFPFRCPAAVPLSLDRLIGREL